MAWTAALPGAPGRLARLGDILRTCISRQRRRGPWRPRRGPRSKALPRRRRRGRAEHARQLLFVNGCRGAAQAADRRGARRLRRLPAARPPSDRGSVLNCSMRARSSYVHPARAVAIPAEPADPRAAGHVGREGQRAASTGGSATIAAFRPAMDAAGTGGTRGVADRSVRRAEAAPPPGLAEAAFDGGGRRGSRSRNLRLIRRPAARRGARAGARDLYLRRRPWARCH